MIGDKLEGGNYEMWELGYERKDMSMDIDVVGSSENDMRLVECIVDEGLGSRGYIRG